MSWEEILKSKQYPPMEEMIKELWKDWLYNDLQGYEHYEFEEYSDGSDAHWSREFSKITDPLDKLDPIDDETQIEQILNKLERFPTLPMETMSWPYIGINHDIDDIRAAYDEMEE